MSPLLVGNVAGTEGSEEGPWELIWRLFSTILAFIKQIMFKVRYGGMERNKK